MIDISLNCYYVINCYYVMQFYVPHRFLKELFGKQSLYESLVAYMSQERVLSRNH